MPKTAAVMSTLLRLRMHGVRRDEAETMSAAGTVGHGSDRSGPECGEVSRAWVSATVRQEFPAIIVSETVDAAVSRPEAVACNLPRGPEGHWRVRRTGPPVQMRRRMVGDPNLVAYVPPNDDSAPTHG